MFALEISNDSPTLNELPVARAQARCPGKAMVGEGMRRDQLKRVEKLGVLWRELDKSFLGCLGITVVDDRGELDSAEPVRSHRVWLHAKVVERLGDWRPRFREADLTLKESDCPLVHLVHDRGVVVQARFHADPCVAKGANKLVSSADLVGEHKVGVKQELDLARLALASLDFGIPACEVEVLGSAAAGDPNERLGRLVGGMQINKNTRLAEQRRKLARALSFIGANQLHLRGQNVLGHGLHAVQSEGSVQVGTGRTPSLCNLDGFKVPKHEVEHTVLLANDVLAGPEVINKALDHFDPDLLVPVHPAHDGDAVGAMHVAQG
mmetsp:Transcript_9331/g.29804  ORF Transcript_9331/g.29804 Transcript_9331/m.29804 type:complete len:322 (-) Transcript_9331:40-1005(-)